MLDEAGIRALIDAELARPEVQYARAALTALLTPPNAIRLDWQYDETGPFDTWVVGRSPDGTIELVHCTEGLGEGLGPWGAVIVSEGHQGMDSQWHNHLLDAAIVFQLVHPPRGYEVP